MRSKVLILLLLALTPATVRSEPLVFFVRHAEKATDQSGGKDPGLSEAGQQRAETLAHFFRDAEIKTIFVSEFKRTQQTAAPLANLIGLTPIILPARDIDGLVKRLRELNGNVLVIGHGDTIPQLIAAFGVTESISIREQDYDNLFVLTRGPGRQLTRLHQPK